MPLYAADHILSSNFTSGSKRDWKLRKQVKLTLRLQMEEEILATLASILHCLRLLGIYFSLSNMHLNEINFLEKTPSLELKNKLVLTILLATCMSFIQQLNRFQFQIHCA